MEQPMSLDMTAGGAFLAGLLSFASPCVLPLVPPYLAYLGILGYIAGVLIALMGLHFLHVIRIPLMNRSARVDVAAKPAGLVGTDVIGLAFGFGWSPCVGPVLTVIPLNGGRRAERGRGRAAVVRLYARHRAAVSAGGRFRLRLHARDREHAC
jgi:cytochrome c-type biogenesis protein